MGRKEGRRVGEERRSSGQSGRAGRLERDRVGERGVRSGREELGLSGETDRDSPSALRRTG